MVILLAGNAKLAIMLGAVEPRARRTRCDAPWMLHLKGARDDPSRDASKAPAPTDMTNGIDWQVTVLNMISVIGTIASIVGLVLSGLAYVEARTAAREVARLRDGLIKRVSIERLVGMLQGNERNLREAVGRPAKIRTLMGDAAAAAGRIEALLDLLPEAIAAPFKTTPSLAVRMKALGDADAATVLNDLAHLLSTAEEYRRQEADKNVGL